MMDWQPIETAPKDGTEILVYACGLVLICWWDRHDVAWVNDELYPGTDMHHQYDPTHWQPLPNPPKEN